MRCRRCRKNLSMWLDGDLPEAVAAEVQTHVEDCPGCSAAKVEILALHAVLAQMPEEQPSPGFDAAFTRKLQDAKRQRRLAEGREKGQKNKRSYWRFPVLAGAAATVCGAAVVLMLIRSPELPGSPSAMELASHLEFLQNYDVVTNLEALEDFEMVESLDALVEADQ